jgi:hypothetical protein
VDISGDPMNDVLTSSKGFEVVVRASTPDEEEYRDDVRRNRGRFVLVQCIKNSRLFEKFRIDYKGKEMLHFANRKKKGLPEKWPIMTRNKSRRLAPQFLGYEDSPGFRGGRRQITTVLVVRYRNADDLPIAFWRFDFDADEDKRKVEAVNGNGKFTNIQGINGIKYRTLVMNHMNAWAEWPQVVARFGEEVEKWSK